MWVQRHRELADKLYPERLIDLSCETSTKQKRGFRKSAAQCGLKLVECSRTHVQTSADVIKASVNQSAHPLSPWARTETGKLNNKHTNCLCRTRAGPETSDTDAQGDVMPSEGSLNLMQSHYLSVGMVYPNTGALCRFTSTLISLSIMYIKDIGKVAAVWDIWFYMCWGPGGRRTGCVSQIQKFWV